MTAPLIVSTVLMSPALAPVPELGFALQLGGLGAALGAVVGLRAKHRTATVDTWRITTAWATLGLIIGVIVSVLGMAL